MIGVKAWGIVDQDGDLQANAGEEQFMPASLRPGERSIPVRILHESDYEKLMAVVEAATVWFRMSRPLSFVEAEQPEERALAKAITALAALAGERP